MDEKGRVVLRKDALQQGFTDGELRSARKRGELILVGRGGVITADQYPAASREDRHLYAVQLALAKTGSASVVSHVSAAIVHGLDVWAISLRRVHVTVDAQSGGRISRVRHVHATPLADREVTVVDGVPVTTVARTVVDLARTEPFEMAVAVGDSALHANKVTVDELRLAVFEAGRRPGVARAARAIAFMDGRSESVGESRSRVLIHRQGLPKPDLQRNIYDHRGRLIGRVDFYWEEFNTIGEFDGLGKYRNRPDSEQAVIDEKLREDELRGTGAAVARWTWDHLETPPTVARRLRTAFDLGQPHAANRRHG